MIDRIVFAIFFCVLSAVVSLIVTPFVIKRMHMQEIVGKDMNKIDKPKVAELGSFGIIFGFIFSIMISIFAFSFLHLFELNLTILLAGFSTIVMMSFLGIFDDVIGWKKGIRQYQHALIPLFAALPLMAVEAGATSMTLPIIGAVELGIFYSLIIIPIGVTGASNATNMLAGLNGLEAGLGSIMTATMLLLGILTGDMEVIILMAAMLGALIGFLKFNWFPAKIFGGDGVTLMIGASIATACIIGNMEKLGIGLFLLFFIELIIKARSRFQAESFGIPQKDGTLKAPERIGSFTHVVMRWGKGKFTEKQCVTVILGLQVVISALVVVWYYLNSIKFFETLFI